MEAPATPRVPGCEGYRGTLQSHTFSEIAIPAQRSYLVTIAAAEHVPLGLLSRLDSVMWPIPGVVVWRHT